MMGLPDSTLVEVQGTFTLLTVNNPCTYWSNTAHIVANGLCRCGRLFEVREVEK